MSQEFVALSDQFKQHKEHVNKIMSEFSDKIGSSFHDWQATADVKLAASGDAMTHGEVEITQNFDKQQALIEQTTQRVNLIERIQMGMAERVTQMAFKECRHPRRLRRRRNIIPLQPRAPSNV